MIFHKLMIILRINFSSTIKSHIFQVLFNLALPYKKNYPLKFGFSLFFSRVNCESLHFCSRNRSSVFSSKSVNDLKMSVFIFSISVSQTQLDFQIGICAQFNRYSMFESSRVEFYILRNTNWESSFVIVALTRALPFVLVSTSSSSSSPFPSLSSSGSDSEPPR